MACSAPLPLPLCFSYKIATNKNVQAQRLVLRSSFWDAFFFTKVSKLRQGHNAVIDSYSGSRGVPSACFQALDFSNYTFPGSCTLSWFPKASSQEDACLCECVCATDALAGGTLLCICWHQLYSLKVSVCLVSQKQTPNSFKQDSVRAYVQKHTDD